MPRKPKAGAWELRPGDLPPDAVVAAHPSLAGLEDNAIFRLSCFGRRAGQRGIWSQLSSGDKFLFGLVMVGLWFGCSFPGLIFGWFVFWHFAPARALETRLADVLGVPKARLGDLVELVIPVEDYATAMWAVRLRRRTLAIRKWTLLVVLALAWLGAARMTLPASVSPLTLTQIAFRQTFFGLIVLFSTFITSAGLWAQRDPGAAALSSARNSARQLSRALESSLGGKKRIFAILWILLVGFILLFLMSMLGFLTGFGFAAINEWIGKEPSLIPTLGLIFAGIGSIAGWALGGFYGFHFKRIAASNYKHMTADLTFCLDWMRERNFAHHEAKAER